MNWVVRSFPNEGLTPSILPSLISLHLAPHHHPGAFGTCMEAIMRSLGGHLE